MGQHEALNSTAYRHIKNMILNNDLEFNVIYSETKIAAELKISRTPIRDALVRLSQEHYIDVIPSKGFMLHKPNAEDLVQARHFRLAIECYCASQIASAPHTPESLHTIAEMERMLKLQYSVADSEHLKDFWQLDVQFHLLLVSQLHNTYFDSLYANCNYLFSSLPVTSFFTENRHLSMLEEHREVIRTLKKGSPQEAARAVASHIEESTNIILQDMEKSAVLFGAVLYTSV